jgi:catechol-2,3-dioxygenase
MRTTDVDRLERFYAGVLGLPVVKRDEMRGSVWLQAGGAVVMLERLEEGEAQVPAGSMDLVAFAGDLAAARERLASAAVPVEGSTAHTIYFRDPDGRRIGVSDYAFP